MVRLAAPVARPPLEASEVRQQTPLTQVPLPRVARRPGAMVGPAPQVTAVVVVAPAAGQALEASAQLMTQLVRGRALLRPVVVAAVVECS